jgi:hypothetical protein
MGRGLGGEGFALVSPSKWFSHGTIVIVNKSQDFGLQIIGGGEVTALKDFASQNGKLNLNLVHPGGVLGHALSRPNLAIGRKEVRVPRQEWPIDIMV